VSQRRQWASRSVVVGAPAPQHTLDQAPYVALDRTSEVRGVDAVAGALCQFDRETGAADHWLE
jgi:hypothetical protein